MKTISVSEAKAGLSKYLRTLRKGEQVVIADRGKPVARLTPIEPSDDPLSDLETRGLVRRGQRPLPDDFWTAPRVKDPTQRLRTLSAEERRSGW